jgi:hypothetical protein
MADCGSLPDRRPKGRDFLVHARIGMPRALIRHVERVVNDPHWGKSKLARDRWQAGWARWA